MAKVNYIQGAKGKMKGSYPDPALPPVMADGLITGASPLASEPDTVNYDALRAVMDEIATPEDGPAWRITDDSVDSDVNMGILAESLYYRLDPAMTENRLNGIEFDDSQRMHLMYSAIGTSRNRLDRAKTDKFAPADQSGWDEWNQEQAARLADTNPELSAAYAAQVGQTPPSALEFDVMKSAATRTRWARTSLFREVRYLAGFHDIDVADAQAAFDAARRDFLVIAKDDRPAAPAWFTESVKDSYFAENRYRKPPLDPATTWALYDTLTNPARIGIYPKTGRNIIVFDTETTGTKHESEIVQITAVEYDRAGNRIRSLSTYVNPGADENGVIFTGDDGAIGVHGITAETVKDAPSFRDIAGDLHEMMEGRTIIGHNVLFDYPKVQRALDLSGHPVLTSGPMVDTMRLARYVAPAEGRRPREWGYKLKTCTERAGIAFDPEQAHDAAYDVDRTAVLFFTLAASTFGGPASD